MFPCCIPLRLVVPGKGCMCARGGNTTIAYTATAGFDTPESRCGLFFAFCTLVFLHRFMEDERRRTDERCGWKALSGGLLDTKFILYILHGTQEPAAEPFSNKGGLEYKTRRRQANGVLRGSTCDISDP